ncbi:MAG: hypothetical protein E6693_02745 [Streptococcus mitis]|jgi:hypothetical protein|uniref:Uncharacterized protein n=1 Tax=Streptococcus mitis TaxID=28037 RepID=A0A3R9HE88_STRMT|nr:hypothetical protein [Streptococcus mitis]MDU3188694.1 hypothetical protein [Streptococcus mitis]RSI61679.1 hypothetical protein D8865_04995 [Streptococcus mitis]
MEYVEAVSQFIEKYYKEKDIQNIEINFWGKENHPHSLYIYKRSKKIKYDHYFFDLLDYYEEPDFLDFKYIVRLENTTYIFWQED